MKSEIVIPGISKKASALALGTAFYTVAKSDTWRKILDRYIESGGTVIDSGRIYGESETVIGQWLESSGVRDKIIIITKGGHGEGHGVPAGEFAATVKKELETSIAELKTDTIDLYMLHRDSPAVPVGEIIECLNAEIVKGSVRAIGASNWEYARISAANDYALRHKMQGFGAVSNNISLAVPAAPFYPGLVSVDKQGEQWHRTTRIPLIVWSAQARGFFTGRFSPELSGNAAPAQDPFTTRMIEVYGTAENLERLRRAKELGEKKGGFSATQVALAWLLYKPFPLIPIVGAATEQELMSCLDATHIPLDKPEIEWLNV